MQTQYATCRTLLTQKQGKGFSEAEAKDFLRQALTQLVRLHDLKQSHGAISLDTIAYDYSRMQIMLLTSNGTNHPNYLAPEVSQTRQAAPTADIYALGVVIIVLLTGLPPEALKAPNDTWNWQDRCIVSDQFIQILNITLSANPAFRYVNAGQMLKALQVILPAEVAIPTIEVDNPSIKPVGISTAPPIAKNLPPNLPAPVPSYSNANSPESLNLAPDYSHKIEKLKAELPDSPTYRKAKTSKEPSKVLKKSKIRILLAILSGVGVTGAGVVGAYFYMQSKSADQKLQFTNAVTDSVNKASASLNQKIKTEENLGKLVTLAKDKYENAGNLTEALTILKAIPPDSFTRAKADKFSAQWQEDNKKSTELVQKAEKAIKEKNWELAINTVKNLSPSPYWQKRGNTIAAEAKKQKMAPPVAVSPNPPAQPETIAPDPQRAPSQEAAVPQPQTTFREAAPAERSEPAPSRSESAPPPPPPRVAN